MEYKDYYKILGVDKKATGKEIKSAYRKLARKYHPDVNPGDKAAEERFKGINEAHEVLSDPEKRKKYDQLGASYRQWERKGGQPGGFDWSRWTTGAPGQGARVEYADFGDLGDIFGGQGLGGFSDFFESLFGGVEVRAQGSSQRRASRSARRGQDMEHSVKVTLEEAFSGTKRVLQMDSQRIEVKIPPGVKTGSRVRLAGKGPPGYGGGQNGDLYLRVKVAKHSRFRRKGDDLLVDVPVDLYTAMLGGEVTLRTLAGSVKLKIPPETQSDAAIRLRGQGMSRLGKPSERGDLLAKVKVSLPRNLTDREKQLFQELAETRD